MLFGYARVSSAEQNPAHQVDALARAGVEAENIHLDHAGGATEFSFSNIGAALSSVVRIVDQTVLRMPLA
ncbi:MULTISPECIES: recombinase family protein [Rhodococcus]|jgi:vancomycin permeability regulator SanA|uniref:recombinase family protein n=1 Tax=Rhodococcus TaxID=1827 RepID=UPI00071E25AA|nr:recombinase family protein [Rhodococcus qingshengii]KSU73660.1 hypothetical protein AS032_20865 [Rhodococcus qingshengii]